MKKYILLLIIVYLLLFGISSAGAYYSCSEYGVMAISDGYGNCSCTLGYVFMTNSFGQSICTHAKNYCTNKYGYGADYNNLTKSCECSYGYIFGKDSLGYISCITNNQECRNQFGYGAESSYGGKCSCSYGYVWGKDSNYSDVCISKLSACSIYGLYAEYDDTSNNCKCKDGYVFKGDTNPKCEKKQNNVYFLLIDLNKDDKEAIIYDLYGKLYYHIKYGIGCNSYQKYIGKNIVINLGTDFDLDIWDKVVLQDDDETCDIIYKEKVDEDYDINCPDEINGYLSNGKCYCNIGYEFIGDSCKLKTNNIKSNTITYNNIISNGDILANAGIITKRENQDDYRINDFVLRQEVIGMAVKVLGKNLDDGYSCRNIFKDVSSIKPNTWSCRAIEISSDFGVVSKTNQYFRPESNITRAEALAIVMKAASIDSSTSSEASQFWDVQNSWQIKATNKALELGIIDKSTNFRPNQNATRGEIFEMTKRILKIK